MRDPLSSHRRAAKALKRAVEAQQPAAMAGWRAVHGDDPVSHTGALHVIARDAGFASWPRMKFAVETGGLDRAALQARLASALINGQHWRVEALLAQDLDLPAAHLGLQIALCLKDPVMAHLARDPGAATRPVDGRLPLLWLAFSRHVKAHPDLVPDMLTIAEALVAQGADVTAGHPVEPGAAHHLSPLYGALGHADNMPLADWLLRHGADPNDDESLYHATELDHHDGLRLLLAAGANPTGTNALLRAMDFNDHTAVRLLLAAGADPNEHRADHAGGQPQTVLPVLHQAARRGCDADMVAILLQAGAEPDARHQGISAYELAAIMCNDAVAQALGPQPVAEALAPLVAAAQGQSASGFVDPSTLPEEARLIIRTLLNRPGRLDHIKRLVALGVETDRPDEMGLTPVQVAGWEGLVDEMAYLLSQRPDLGHVNAFGGTLLSTILHGAEHSPSHDSRDHLTCTRLVLEHGVALPRSAITSTGREDIAALLEHWAEAHPGQVVEG